MTNWNKRFLNLASYIGTWSKDRSRGIGCVIVGLDKEILSIGYNGFPRGVDDEVDERHVRPEKYFWTEHAERNAIFNAARHGIKLKDTICYSSLMPCAECMRAIIQSGISQVVTVKSSQEEQDRYWKSMQIAKTMAEEAGLRLVVYDS